MLQSFAGELFQIGRIRRQVGPGRGEGVDVDEDDVIDYIADIDALMEHVGEEG